MMIRLRELACCVAILLGTAVRAGGQQWTRYKQPRRDTASTFRIYGFVQGDGIFDFDSNDPDWFDVVRPTKLPAFNEEFGKNDHTYFSARQTRFGVKSTIPTKKYDVQTAFEFDMFGVGIDAGQTTIRLRLAYGQWGPFGAGQLWTPFMDVDVFPNILDYWGPNGMTFFRNVMVFCQPIYEEKGHQVTVALERPGASGDAGLFSDRIDIQNIIGRFPWPDLSASYKYAKDWGYVKLGGIVRSIRWDDRLRDTFDLSGGTTGAGVSISSNLKPTKNDVIRLQYVYGKGIQNYFNDAPVDIGAVVNVQDRRKPVLGEALPIWGLVAFLDHNWNKVWSSSIGYSHVSIDNSTGQLPNAFRLGSYGIANVLAQVRPDVMMGGEFQWARRANFNDGFAVNDFRLQFSFRYNYDHKWVRGRTQ